MPSKEVPSYSSARVQRATRINGIEAARLQQRLQYLEQAKLHQCRLTNQDIRLISMSIDYIQSSSGHSAEAWRPQPKPEEEVEPEEKGPCFLYGERIWSRKKRRLQRPMSAVERSGRTLVDEDEEGSESLASPRPLSSPGKHRPISAGPGWCRIRTGVEDNHNLTTAEMDAGSEKVSSHASTPRGRVTPHQDWEDDTSDITKKILKSQARAQSGTHRSVYQSQEDVMNATSSRNIRGLMRQIRISATPVTTDYINGRPASRHDYDQSPRRPGDDEHGLDRKATLGEILNQRRPTLSAGAWRSHLRQTSATPMSISAHRRLVMETRKELNAERTAEVNERVKHFIKTSPRAKSGRRPKSAFR